MTKQQRAKEEENELHFNILRGVKNGKEYRPRLNLRKRTSVDELAYILWAILSLFFSQFWLLFFCIIHNGFILFGWLLESAGLCLVEQEKCFT